MQGVSDCFCLGLIPTSEGSWVTAVRALSGEDRSSLIAFHQPFVFLITLLTAIVGLHFQVLDVTPLKTHFTITLLLIMAAIFFSIAYARINRQPCNSEYLSLFRFAYLASGFLICELLVGLLMSPLWWFMMNLCTFLIQEILRRWHQPIYQFVCQSRDWLQTKFEAVLLAASEAFSLTRDTEEQQNGGNRLPV
ncbi:hypothetical protein SO802_009304 [Lithocarpus litseifolius]|uniref:Transmembrane protein n=1 Tax=Lithocarpus litseifolius TaxID=425828 RepID=A0AAW2DD64_9ROSI